MGHIFSIATTQFCSIEQKQPQIICKQTNVFQNKNFFKWAAGQIWPKDHKFCFQSTSL